MAKKSSVEKQKRRQETVSRYWERRSAIKKVAADVNASHEERELARLKLNKMPRDSSPCRLRNRCQLTGRARAYLRKFGISRICFRQMANFGLIPGVTKASW